MYALFLPIQNDNHPPFPFLSQNNPPLKSAMNNIFESKTILKHRAYQSNHVL